jgi:hypothetical protein
MTELAASTGIADFALPGRWWRIPLDTEGSIEGSAQAMARELIGRGDEVAGLRRDLVRDVVAAATAARAGNGQDFYFALEITPGVGVPISLTVYWPELPTGPSREHAATAAASLAASLEKAEDPGEVAILELSPVAGVVRTTRAFAPSVPVAEVTAADQLGRLDLSYWVLQPGATRTLLMAFSTSMVDLREPVTGLCDAVVATVTWREAAGAGTTVREAGHR